MKRLKVILLDDEQEALDILSSLLTDTGKVEIIKVIDNPLKLECSISSLNPDAVFTDIEMPNYNGIEILKNIREYLPGLPIIFVTAHKKFSLEIAKYNPFSYLLKPVNRKELSEVVDRLLFYYENSDKDNNQQIDKITLPVTNGMIYVSYDEIFSLTADGNYTKIKLTDGIVRVSSYNLGRLHEQLNSKQFVRINRKTVINCNYLKEIYKRKKTCIVKANDITEEIEISKSFLKSFNK